MSTVLSSRSRRPLHEHKYASSDSSSSSSSLSLSSEDSEVRIGKNGRKLKKKKGYKFNRANGLTQTFAYDLNPRGMAALMVKRAKNVEDMYADAERKLRHKEEKELEMNSNKALRDDLIALQIEEKKINLQKRLTAGQGKTDDIDKSYGAAAMSSQMPKPALSPKSVSPRSSQGDVSPKAQQQQMRITQRRSSIAARFAEKETVRRGSIAGPLMEGHSTKDFGSIAAMVGPHRDVKKLFDDKTWRTYAISKCAILRKGPPERKRNKSDSMATVRFYVDKIKESITQAWPELTTIAVSEWNGMVRISVRMSQLVDLLSEISFIAYMNSFMHADPTIVKFKLKKNQSMWATRVVTDAEQLSLWAADQETKRKAGRLVFTCAEENTLNYTASYSIEDAAKEMEMEEAAAARMLNSHKSAIMKTIMPNA